MSIDQIGSVVQPVVSQVQNGVPRPAGGDQSAGAESVKSSGGVQQVAQTSAATAKNAGELDGAIKTANRFLDALSQNLQFSIDKDTDKTVVKLVDVNTKEVIRQIPSKEMLDLAKALDKLQGLLIKEKA